MQVHIRPLDRRELAGFRPYLLPDTRRRLEQGSDGVLALGAVVGRSSCAAAAALIAGERASLTDLFVDEAVRRQGVGGLLLDALLEELKRRDVRVVSACYALEEETLAAMDRLLASRGFSQPQVTARTFRTDSACYHDSRFLRRSFRPDYRTPENVLSFAQLPDALLETMAMDEDIEECLSWEANRHRAVPELSVALVGEDGVLAYLLCGESDDGGCVLLAANSREDAPPTAFLTLLNDMLNRCYYRGGDFPLYFSATTERAQRLALDIMGDNYTEYAEHFRDRLLPPAAERAQA